MSPALNCWVLDQPRTWKDAESEYRDRNDLWSSSASESLSEARHRLFQNQFPPLARLHLTLPNIDTTLLAVLPPSVEHVRLHDPFDFWSIVSFFEKNWSTNERLRHILKESQPSISAIRIPTVATNYYVSTVQTKNVIKSNY